MNETDLRQDLRQGSRWKHVKRGSVAVVLKVTDTEVSFQFPSGINNPAQGKGRWPIVLFLERFVRVEGTNP
jgi:hypothetical protein